VSPGSLTTGEARALGQRARARARLNEEAQPPCQQRGREALARRRSTAAAAARAAAARAFRREAARERALAPACRGGADATAAPYSGTCSVRATLRGRDGARRRAAAWRHTSWCGCSMCDAPTASGAAAAARALRQESSSSATTRRWGAAVPRGSGPVALSGQRCAQGLAVCGH
jgi:hypothetical protein